MRTCLGFEKVLTKNKLQFYYNRFIWQRLEGHVVGNTLSFFVFIFFLSKTAKDAVGRLLASTTDGAAEQKNICNFDYGLFVTSIGG